MKNYSLLLLTSLIIISCSSSDQKESSESPASNYVEYVWHSAEENFNAEKLSYAH